ncbi:MAG: hypothetical protein AB7P69_07640, partial [Candidatus Binatia bacterium]
LVRNNADSADAAATVSKLNVSGDVIDINSDAPGSGADWKYTLQRPSSGMTAAVTLTLPPDDGSPSQVLQTDGNGNLSWASAGSTASADKIDTTSLAFGDSSPAAMFSTGSGDIVTKIQVVIDTPFDGTPSLSVGVSGTTSKYLASTEVDLTAPAGTVFEVNPGKEAQGVEALIATYSSGGAAQGAARILTYYGTPS